MLFEVIIWFPAFPLPISHCARPSFVPLHFRMTHTVLFDMFWNPDIFMLGAVRVMHPGAVALSYSLLGDYTLLTKYGVKRQKVFSSNVT